MKRRIRVGTRESKLAIVQSNLVIDQIREKFPEYEFEVIGFRTQGDRILDQRLDTVGGKGLFTGELERALRSRTIDMAVHSMKDMPAGLPDGLTIAAVSKREDPRDVLISRDGKRLEQLGEHAVAGTSSVRRELQLLQLRPDLEIRLLRGNVPTRIEKLDNREYDAIVLAMAGLKRLGLSHRCIQCFEIGEMIPAAGQGALGIETRADEDVAYLKESIHDEETALAVQAERACMKRLDGGCSTPAAAHAVLEGGKMTVYGFLAREDKSAACRDRVEGGRDDAEALGEMLADRMLRQLEGM